MKHGQLLLLASALMSILFLIGTVAPIPRRFLLALACTLFGLVLTIGGVERFVDKQPHLASKLAVCGLLVIATGWIMWWLTFAYPASRGWWL